MILGKEMGNILSFSFCISSLFLPAAERYFIYISFRFLAPAGGNKEEKKEEI